MTDRVWVNGIENGKLSMNDPGITRGMIIFETLRTYGKQPFRLEPHLERLASSATFLGIPMPSADLLLGEIRAALDENIWIRISLTLGGQRAIQTEPIGNGVVGREMDLATLPLAPSPWLPGSVKHCSRAAWVLAAQALDVEEVVFIDEHGFILEANRSNVIAIVDGVVWTPPPDGRILEGITAIAMLDAAATIGLPTRREPLPLNTQFDELYLSSTLKELSPVRMLDNRQIGGGPVGTQLHAAFRELVARECRTKP
jgi:branched-subunit amino acid aminotransferase/4-amino-4-deoxychorismate lyase